MIDFLALSALQVALVLDQQRMAVWEWRLKRLCLVPYTVTPILWVVGHVGIQYASSPSAEGYSGLLVFLTPCTTGLTLAATFLMLACELWQVSKTFGTGSQLKKRVEKIAKGCALFGALWLGFNVMTVCCGLRCAVLPPSPGLHLHRSLGSVFLYLWVLSATV
jgi:hypothetical protein